MIFQKGIFILLIAISVNRVLCQDVNLLDLYWSAASNRTLVTDQKNAASLKAQNDYLIQEISRLTFLATGKTFNVNSYILLERYGYHQYNESSMTAGVTKSLTSSVIISAGAGVNRIRIPEMVFTDVHLTGELSARFILTKQVQLSSSLLKISSKGEHTVQPGVINMMIQYNPSTDVWLASGFLKFEGIKKLQAFAEFHYHINKFMLAGSVASSPLRYSLGYSWKLRSLKVYMGMAYHSKLGPSPSSSVTWVKF